jgi:thiosulfate/3-mercaptopyruvate sulfurtransferase
MMCSGDSEMLKTLLTVCVFACAASAAVKSDLLVSTAWLADHLKDSNVIVLHVAQARTGYDANHIPGARYLAFGEIAVTKNGNSNELPTPEELKAIFEKAGVSDNSRVILYTSDANILPATRAFFTLDYLGHDQTALLDGGFEQWSKENRPVAKDVPAVAPGKLTPRPRPQLVVSTADVQKQAAAPSTGMTLLDVRSSTEFSERGHIPTALNSNWTESLNGTMNMKSEAELRKLFESAGLAPGKTVVTYCNSGMQASESYFTLKYLGYDVKMYDGSLGEWNKTTGTTLVK